MNVMSSDPKINALIRQLAPSDYEALAPHLSEMELHSGQRLLEPQQNISVVIFPTSGIVSFVVQLLNGESIEAGMVGRDGVIGASAILNGRAALNTAIVQMPGAAL